MNQQPVWLLDIDGVLNANKPGWGAAPRRITCAGYTIRWAPALIQRINAIERAGAAEVRWSSTWCGEPADLANLSDRIGLHLDSAFTERAAHQTWAEMKAEAAIAVLQTGRPLVWTDDTEAVIAQDFYPQLREAAQNGRALLIAPRPNRGLQPDDLDRIEAFCKETQ
jgi:hypothetical protein